MKRILIVMPDLKSGGAERSLVNFLTECDEKRYKIDLLLFRKSGDFLKQIPQFVNVIEPDKLTRDLFAMGQKIGLAPKIIKYVGSGVGKICSPCHWDKGRQIRWNAVYRHFIPVLKRKYDVAIAYLEGEATYYVADKVIADKKICWFHSDYSKLKYSTIFDRRVFKKMRWIATISDECVDIMRAKFPTLKEKIIKIENITSERVILKRAEEVDDDAYENNDNTLRLLSIGRLVPEKGFDLAVAAAAILKKKGVNFKWNIIGEGPKEKELKLLAREMRVEDSVKFLGIRENPYPYIKQCDIVVQTSRFEGKSIVLDEAKIMKKPIVVTNYSTVHDQIIAGKEGMIVEISSEAIADGIIRMYQNNEERTVIIDFLNQNNYGNSYVVNKYYKVID